MIQKAMHGLITLIDIQFDVFDSQHAGLATHFEQALDPNPFLHDLPGWIAVIGGRIHQDIALCWLHEISAEKIESFPLQLSGLLTTVCPENAACGNVLAIPDSNCLTMTQTSPWFVLSSKENDNQLLVDSQHNGTSES
jgi:hypothetical protein